MTCPHGRTDDDVRKVLDSNLALNRELVLTREIVREFAKVTGLWRAEEHPEFIEVWKLIKQWEGMRMDQPLRYTKLPITIEAIQYTGDNKTEVENFAGEEDERGWNVLVSWNHGHSPAVYDKLHGTWVSFSDNHWIVKGIKGEFYPCADEVFQETYKLAE